jgi:flavin-dependent dehydrogenase
MINDGSATLNGLTAEGIAEGIKQQKQAHRDAMLGLMKRRNEQLLSQLQDAKRQIAEMEADARSNNLPRYGGHLFSTARQILETCVTLETMNNSL